MHKLGRYTCLLMMLLATPVHAYIGPGASAGAIAVVLGIIASIFLAFVAILWYPFKRLYRNWKAKPKKTDKT
jgi:hypothetical protein